MCSRRFRLPLLLVCSLFVTSLSAQNEQQLAALVQAGDFARARVLLAQLIEQEPAEPRHRYNLACAEARLGFSELAFEALESALRLGFRNRALLLEDPDLEPLRTKPRFQELVRRVPASTSTPAVRETVAPVRSPPPAAPLPVAPRLTPQGPVGLYFMTRFWMSSGLEQKVWYFDAEGRVYLSPGPVFTPEALARDAERSGRRTLGGEKMRVVWSDGKETESNYKADGSQSGFSWDAGIFSAVARPDWSRVAGTFEGGASFSGASGGGSSVSTLTLRSDGTFTWSRSASLRGESSASQVSAGSVGAPRDGRWRGEGYQLTLTFADGRAERFVAFPTPDPRDAARIGMLFFNGSMHLAKNR